MIDCTLSQGVSTMILIVGGFIFNFWFWHAFQYCGLNLTWMICTNRYHDNLIFVFLLIATAGEFPNLAVDRKFELSFLKLSLSCPRLSLRRDCCPKLSLSCPKLSLSSPKLSLSCPKLSLSCPRLSFSCPKLLLSCPRLSLSCPRLSLSCSQSCRSLLACLCCFETSGSDMPFKDWLAFLSWMLDDAWICMSSDKTRM